MIISLGRKAFFAGIVREHEFLGFEVFEDFDEEPTEAEH
jgi:hypothetical protein